MKKRRYLEVSKWLQSTWNIDSCECLSVAAAVVYFCSCQVPLIHYWRCYLFIEHLEVHDRSSFYCEDELGAIVLHTLSNSPLIRWRWRQTNSSENPWALSSNWKDKKLPKDLRNTNFVAILIKDKLKCRNYQDIALNSAAGLIPVMKLLNWFLSFKKFISLGQPTWGIATGPSTNQYRGSDLEDCWALQLSWWLLTQSTKITSKIQRRIKLAALGNCSDAFSLTMNGHKKQIYSKVINRTFPYRSKPWCPGWAWRN